MIVRVSFSAGSFMVKSNRRSRKALLEIYPMTHDYPDQGYFDTKSVICIEKTYSKIHLWDLNFIPKKLSLFHTNKLYISQVSFQVVFFSVWFVQ